MKRRCVVCLGPDPKWLGMCRHCLVGYDEIKSVNPVNEQVRYVARRARRFERARQRGK